MPWPSDDHSATCLEIIMFLAAASLFEFSLIQVLEKTDSFLYSTCSSALLLFIYKLLYNKYRRRIRIKTLKKYSLPYVRYDEGFTNL